MNMKLCHRVLSLVENEKKIVKVHGRYLKVVFLIFKLYSFNYFDNKNIRNDLFVLKESHKNMYEFNNFTIIILL